jgi:hypothetical protein
MLEQNGDRGKRKILSLDCETYEFQVLENLEVDILLEFDQIVMEWHQWDDYVLTLENPEF